mmetsp:Transcript_14670/g.28908  ORF Transcript_14670/g.28908 Transcript_14670/m.28908 type:complete len:268 (+) Transcript_14670:88-891(+)
MVKDAIGGDAKTVGIAAGTASVIQATFLLPINSVQTRMQAGGLRLNATLRIIFADGALSGLRQLYLALPPTVAMLGMKQGLIFGSGAELKKQTPQIWPEWARDATSMGISALVCTAFLFPMDTLKTRLQVGKPLPGMCPSQWYRGFVPAVSHAVVGRPVWMVMRNGLERNVPDPQSHSLQYWKHFVCGGLTGTVVTLVVFPLDTLKKLLQTNGQTHVSIRTEVKTLFKSGGIHRFYRGFSVKLAMNFTQGALFNTIFVACNKFIEGS